MATRYRYSKTNETETIVSPTGYAWLSNVRRDSGRYTAIDIRQGGEYLTIEVKELDAFKALLDRAAADAEKMADQDEVKAAARLAKTKESK